MKVQEACLIGASIDGRVSRTSTVKSELASHFRDVLKNDEPLELTFFVRDVSAICLKEKVFFTGDKKTRLALGAYLNAGIICV